MCTCCHHIGQYLLNEKNLVMIRHLSPLDVRGRVGVFACRDLPAFFPVGVFSDVFICQPNARLCCTDTSSTLVGGFVLIVFEHYGPAWDLVRG